MSAGGEHEGVGADETRVAVPLWGLGAALFAWGLLRGRPLLLAAGAAAFFADHRAEPVVRVRELLAELHDAR